MFGGGSSLFGNVSQPTTSTGIFGNYQQQPSQSTGLFGASTTDRAGGIFGNTPRSGLFGPQSTPIQQKTPQTSLFSTPFEGRTPGGGGGGFFGATTTTPNISLFGTAVGETASTPFLPQKTTSTQQNVVPPEIQPILANLSNADLRSCQVLSDIFMKLKQFLTEKPTLIAFTYEVDFDLSSLESKRQQLEQQLLQLNNAALIQSYTLARRKNPDSSKYALVPLHNFDGLVRRAETQVQHIERVNSILIEFKARQERIGNHLKIAALKRLDDISKRQRYLQSNLIRVVGILEEYAIRNQIAQLDVQFLRRLQSDLAGMSDELRNSSAGRPKLNELTTQLARVAHHAGVQIRARPQTFMTQAGGASTKESSKAPGSIDEPEKKQIMVTGPNLSERDYKVIFSIVQKQQTLFESLATVIHRDTAKLKRLLQVAEGQNGSSTVGVPSSTSNGQRQLQEFSLYSGSFATPNSKHVQTGTPKRLF